MKNYTNGNEKSNGGELKSILYTAEERIRQLKNRPEDFLPFAFIAP